VTFLSFKAIVKKTPSSDPSGHLLPAGEKESPASSFGANLFVHNTRPAARLRLHQIKPLFDAGKPGVDAIEVIGKAGILLFQTVDPALDVLHIDNESVERPSDRAQMFENDSIGWHEVPSVGISDPFKLRPNPSRDNPRRFHHRVKQHVGARRGPFL
jgi:hypothetical protein